MLRQQIRIYQRFEQGQSEAAAGGPPRNGDDGIRRSTQCGDSVYRAAFDKLNKTITLFNLLFPNINNYMWHAFITVFLFSM